MTWCVCVFERRESRRALQRAWLSLPSCHGTTPPFNTTCTACHHGGAVASIPLLLPKSRLYRRNHALPRRRPDRVHHDGPLRIRAVRELCVATARLRVHERSSNSDLKIARRSSVLRERDDDGVAKCSTQTLSHCAGVPRVPSPAAVLNVHNGLRHCAKILVASYLSTLGELSNSSFFSHTIW